MTYYLPGKARQPRLQVRLRGHLRLVPRSASTGSRVRTGCRTSTPAGAADRIRFVDTGAPGDYGSGWTTSANVDQHYAGYVQDRWAPNNRLTITAGVRFDYQNVGYKDGTREAEICDVDDGVRQCRPTAAAIFPMRARYVGRRVVPQEHERRGRASASATTSTGDGEDGAEGVLRPLLQQPRRRLLRRRTRAARATSSTTSTT